jgi:hypothetical protein
MKSAREKKLQNLGIRQLISQVTKKLLPLVGSFRIRGTFSHLLFKLAFFPICLGKRGFKNRENLSSPSDIYTVYKQNSGGSRIVERGM